MQNRHFCLALSAVAAAVLGFGSCSKEDPDVIVNYIEKELPVNIEVTETTKTTDAFCQLAPSNVFYMGKGETKLIAEFSSDKYRPVKFASSNPEVATVDDNGKITATGKYGMSIVTAGMEDGIAIFYGVYVLPENNYMIYGMDVIELGEVTDDWYFGDVETGLGFIQATYHQFVFTDKEGNKLMQVTAHENDWDNEHPYFEYDFNYDSFRILSNNMRINLEGWNDVTVKNLFNQSVNIYLNGYRKDNYPIEIKYSGTVTKKNN